jgi:hypothetical protein
VARKTHHRQKAHAAAYQRRTVVVAQAVNSHTRHSRLVSSPLPRSLGISKRTPFVSGDVAISYLGLGRRASRVLQEGKALFGYAHSLWLGR